MAGRSSIGSHRVCRCHVSWCAPSGAYLHNKAVRPTNVMGASKRLAELVVQAHSVEGKACFSMVRFGNAGVLGLSGASISPPDCCRWADYPHAPRDHPLLHDHPGGCFACAAGLTARRVEMCSCSIWENQCGSEHWLNNGAAEWFVTTIQHPDGDIEIVCTGLRLARSSMRSCLSKLNQPGAPLIYRAQEQCCSL